MINSGSTIRFNKLREREAASTDSTLAEGRAAVDTATRNILTRTSGRVSTPAGCLPARNLQYSYLAKPETHFSIDSSTQCLHRKNDQQHYCYWSLKIL